MTSFQAYGVCSAILITGDREIVNGHFMVDAAKRLGFETMVCIIIDQLDSEEIRMLRMALNRNPRNAVFDLDAIQLEMRELIALDFPIELTGFSLPEIDQILQDNRRRRRTRGTRPRSRSSRASRHAAGGSWTLGRNAIIAGNALERDDYARLLRGFAIRLVLTDEPYNLKVQGHITRGDHAEFPMASGEMSDEQFLDFIAAWIERAMEWVVDGGVIASFIDWRGIEAIP